MSCSVPSVNTAVTLRPSARGPDQLSPLLSFKTCLIGFSKRPEGGKRRELACYETFCSGGGGGSLSPVLAGHLWWPLIRARAGLEPVEDPLQGRNERGAETAAQSGPQWHPHTVEPRRQQTTETLSSFRLPPCPPHVWGQTPVRPPSLFQLPHSNWFKSCLVPSGQSSSILAAVTGLCLPLTVLLYWCCAASYYCANENLAPDIIFFFTGCAPSMLNISGALIGLKALIIFNVRDRMVWNTVLWAGKQLLGVVKVVVLPKWI